MTASGSAVQLRHYGRVHKLKWSCSKRGPTMLGYLAGRVGLESLKCRLHTRCLPDGNPVHLALTFMSLSWLTL